MNYEIWDGFATAYTVEASRKRDSVNVRFGNRLGSLREERDIDEEEVASRLHIPLSRLHELEDGSCSVSLIELELFATVFNLSVSALLQNV